MSAQWCWRRRKWSYVLCAALAALLAACGGSGSNVGEDRATNESTTAADGNRASDAGTDGLFSGPKGRKLNDLGAISDFGVIGSNFSIAQTNGSILVVDRPLLDEDPSVAKSRVFSVEKPSGVSSLVATTSELMYGVTTNGDRALVAMHRCPAPAPPLQSCFATLSPPKFSITPVAGSGPTGVTELRESGTGAYLLTVDGTLETGTRTITKVLADGTIDVAAWPQVTLPKRSANVVDQQIDSIVSLTPDTSLYVTGDRLKWRIDWKTGAVTADGTIAGDGDGPTLCGGGANTFVLDFAGDDWTNPDVRVRPATGQDRWNAVLKPDGGTNGGFEFRACAATKTSMWILVSGELFEVNAADGELLNRFDLRQKGDKRGGMDVQLSVSDEAIVAITNDHLYAVS